MYDAKRDAEQQRIAYEQTRAQAENQGKIIEAKTGIEIAEHKAAQKVKEAEGEAQRILKVAEAEAKRTEQIGNAEAAVIESKGKAQAEAYRLGGQALTPGGLTSVEVVKAIAAAGLKIVPDVMVTGGGDGDGGANGGLVNLLLANAVKNGLGGSATAAAPAEAPVAPAAEGGEKS